jgi:hypothetical protein
MSFEHHGSMSTLKSIWKHVCNFGTRYCIFSQELWFIPASCQFMSPFYVMYFQDFCILELTLVMDKKVGEIPMSIQSFQRLLDESKINLNRILIIIWRQKFRNGYGEVTS